MSKLANPPKFNMFSIVLIWLILLAATTFIFNEVLERFHNPNQTLEVFVNEFGDPEVRLIRNRYGHYVATGKINGTEVDFLVDTGATLVAIPEHIANKLGLKKRASFKSETANGLSTSYRTRLDRLSLGDIVMTNVAASISSGMKFDEILLGMSFLKHLKITQQDKELILSLPTQHLN